MSKPKPSEFVRRYATRDAGVLLAYRAWRDGEEDDLFAEQARSIAELTEARVAHEKAQERLDTANRRERERRDWFAREVLRACGQPEHDRSFEEAIVYTSGGEVVVAVGRIERLA